MPDDADVEPDEEWKSRLRNKIEENLASMVKEAKDSRDNQLREAPVSAEDRERLTAEYKTAMNNIRQLAAEQFQIELDRERQERRWASGIPMNPHWTEALKQEQQTIMDGIKRGGSTQPGSGMIAESPVEELSRPRLPGARTMSNHDPPPSLPQPPAQQEKAAKAERDRERVARPIVPAPPQPVAARRGSDAHSAPSRDREDHFHSLRKAAGHGALHERPSLPDTWATPEATEESEDLLKRPRRPTLERPNTVDKWDPSSPLSATRTPDRERSQRSVSERHTAHSPPNSIPAIWKPSISPEEDAAASKPYNLGRRGSTASMRSIGSATGIRPPATEPIPEKPDDDAIHEGGNDRGKGPIKESDKPWISPPERKESGLHRSDSRSYPVPGERDDRAGMATRRTSPIPYPAPSSTARPIVSKASFNDDHRYERPKAQYLADRDQPSPLSAGPLSAGPRSAKYDRDLPHPSAGARPIAHTFPHGEDRDYSPSPPYRDHNPHQHRSSPPDSAGFGERGITPKHSFSNEDYQDARRDRERERQYSSLSSSRPSYPTPPSSATRTGSREYLHNDSFDDRERLDRHRTPDESDHRSMRARQGSYSSRPPWDETERDRRYDDYSARSHHGGPSTTKPITVPRHHAPPPLSEEVSSWKDWAGIPEGRRGYDPNFRPPQLPPIPGPVIAPHSADPILPRRRDSYRSTPHSARYHDEPASHSRRHRPYDDDELEEDYGDEPGPPKDNFLSHAPMRVPSASRRKDRKTQEEEEEEMLRRLEAEKQRVLEERERRKQLELEAGKLKRETTDEEDETDETDDDEEEKQRQEEEETRKRAEEQKRVEEEKQKLEEERKQVEEEKRKVEEEKKKMEDEKKKIDDEKRKAEQEEAKRLKDKKKEEKKQTEEKRKAEAALKLLEAESRKRQEEAERLEEQIRDKMAEAERLEKEALEKEAIAKRLQEEAQAKAAKVNQMNTLAKKREAEMRQREHALRQRENELSRREEEYSRREEEMRAQEERENEEKERIRLEEEEKERVRLENEEKERVQAEEAAKAREAERKERLRQLEDERQAKFQREQAQAQLEDARRREAQRREEANRIVRERQAEEDRVRNEQQEEFRRREEEIKRRSEERKRQDSIGAEGIWPAPSPSPSTSRSPPQRNGSVNTPAGDRTSNGSSSAWSASSSNWSSSTKATTASNTSASSNTVPNRATPVPSNNKPRAGSVGSGGTFSFGTPPQPTPTPMSEADWQRRQAEQARKQQEQFRKEQERLEAERQAKAGGRQLTRDEVIWLFENHEKLWASLPSSDAVWNDFPWPMIKKPSEPEEITLPAIRAYIESPYYPEKDKSKTVKDRVKDHIKRWHPDRFNTKLLTKVREEDKEKVKEGAGNVVRCLNELLAKTNGPLFD